jgi:hypothetical protein
MSVTRAARLTRDKGVSSLRRIQGPHRLLLSLALVTGCATPPPTPTGEATSPIIGGTVDSADPAIVLLVSYSQDHQTLDTCTAAVIAPTVLLTAAHCVDAPNHPNYGFGVFTGPDASAYPDVASFLPVLLAVQEVHPHPSYDPAVPFTADIGVIVMAQPLNITPLPINRVALTQAIVGQTARIVGYGQTVYGQYNAVKHDAQTVVDSLGADDTVVVGDGTHRSCIGDSGGPALVTLAGVETIIGEDSYTNTTGCIDPANYRRTDSYTAFLDAYAPPTTSASASTSSASTSATGSSGSTSGTSSAASTGAGAGTGSTSSSASGSGGAGGAPKAAKLTSGGCSIGDGGNSSGLVATASLLVAFGRARRRRRR